MNDPNKPRESGGPESGDVGGSRHAGSSEIPLRQPARDSGRGEAAGGVSQSLAAFSGEDPARPWVRDERSSFADIDREEAELASWASGNDAELGSDAIRAIAAQAVSTAQGNEHDLFFTPVHAFRFTNGDKYGLPYRTPREYLRRWDKSNKLFPQAAVEFVGFYRKPNGNGVIVTRQPFIRGRRGSEKEIAAALAEKGFVPNGKWSYRSPGTGLEIYDAHGGNVLFDKAGKIIPIDVWVNDPGNVLG
ncbi:hypothetical protein [Luteolibacter sp. Populi]|uniref:putative polyvalent protein kinase domain-containing protein n=1 Tax=Luteolibacter sp. Populi TaxID=3230487 RepID=UPI003467888D